MSLNVEVKTYCHTAESQRHHRKLKCLKRFNSPSTQKEGNNTCFYTIAQRISKMRQAKSDSLEIMQGYRRHSAYCSALQQHTGLAMPYQACTAPKERTEMEDEQLPCVKMAMANPQS
ncbi:hypothetical protein EK904_003080 [Melospiza melodia maxima]|nr:hypothetical protein EK904_003080 [Melospiza melodia maxima]